MYDNNNSKRYYKEYMPIMMILHNIGGYLIETRYNCGYIRDFSGQSFGGSEDPSGPECSYKSIPRLPACVKRTCVL